MQEDAPQPPGSNGKAKSLFDSFEARLDMNRFGMWLLLGALTMMFGALVVLYLVRAQDRLNYFFKAPGVLWLSTTVLLVSSVTFHLAVQRARLNDVEGVRKFISTTLLLGCCFFLSQTTAWLELIRAGVYAATNPFSGLFYVLTGLHAAHLLIGMGLIIHCRRLAKRGAFTAKKHRFLDFSAMYWHFMDAVWLVFFILVMFV